MTPLSAVCGYFYGSIELAAPSCLPIYLPHITPRGCNGSAANLRGAHCEDSLAFSFYLTFDFLFHSIAYSTHLHAPYATYLHFWFRIWPIIPVLILAPSFYSSWNSISVGISHGKPELIQSNLANRQSTRRDDASCSLTRRVYTIRLFPWNRHHFFGQTKKLIFNRHLTRHPATHTLINCNHLSSAVLH